MCLACHFCKCLSVLRIFSDDTVGVAALDPFCEGDLVMEVSFIVKQLSSGGKLNAFTCFRVTLCLLGKFPIPGLLLLTALCHFSLGDWGTRGHGEWLLAFTPLVQPLLGMLKQTVGLFVTIYALSFPEGPKTIVLKGLFSLKESDWKKGGW